MTYYFLLIWLSLYESTVSSPISYSSYIDTCFYDLSWLKRCFTKKPPAQVGEEKLLYWLLQRKLLVLLHDQRFPTILTEIQLINLCGSQMQQVPLIDHQKVLNIGI